MLEEVNNDPKEALHFLGFAKTLQIFMSYFAVLFF